MLSPPLVRQHHDADRPMGYSPGVSDEKVDTGSPRLTPLRSDLLAWLRERYDLWNQGGIATMVSDTWHPNIVYHDPRTSPTQASNAGPRPLRSTSLSAGGTRTRRHNREECLVGARRAPRRAGPRPGDARAASCFTTPRSPMSSVFARGGPSSSASSCGVNRPSRHLERLLGSRS